MMEYDNETMNVTASDMGEEGGGNDRGDNPQYAPLATVTTEQIPRQPQE